MNKHKYLEDIGIETKVTPWGWNQDDSRQKQWKEDRKLYGFDERETWSLDTTFFYWLYERVMMYNEINCIDTSFHELVVNNEKLTQQECIDRIILGCKYYFKLTEGVSTNENYEIAMIIANEILDIWKQLVFWMSW